MVAWQHHVVLHIALGSPTLHNQVKAPTVMEAEAGRVRYMATRDGDAAAAKDVTRTL